MASFFRRRRSLLIKAIIVIPVLWFLAVLVLGHGPSLGAGESREGGGFMPGLFGKGKGEQPLQPPADVNVNNPDRRIHEDVRRREEEDANAAAAAAARKKEEESIRRQKEEEERRRKEEEDAAERRRKEAALQFESERKAREDKVDPNAPGIVGPLSVL